MKTIVFVRINVFLFFIFYCLFAESEKKMIAESDTFRLIVKKLSKYESTKQNKALLRLHVVSKG